MPNGNAAYWPILAALALIGCLLGMLAPLPAAPPDEPLAAALSVLLNGDADDLI